MRSRRSKTFREHFRALPTDVKRQAYAAYRLFAQDPYHPSLRFKRLRDKLYSVRVGISHRALGVMLEDDLIVWVWIGSHADYDKLI